MAATTNETAPKQHTPGPWTWEFSGTMGRWTLLGSQGKPVEVGGPPGQGLSADQELIASAPALHEAIADALAMLENGHNFPNVFSQRDAARTILRRAMGRV